MIDQTGHSVSTVVEESLKLLLEELVADSEEQVRYKFTIASCSMFCGWYVVTCYALITFADIVFNSACSLYSTQLSLHAIGVLSFGSLYVILNLASYLRVVLHHQFLS